MDRLMRAAEEGSLTLEQFKARVRQHLGAALDTLPNIPAAPSDVFDPGIHSLVDEINALDTFIHAIGYDARRHDDREETRERTVAAKRRDPTLEERVCVLDGHVQRFVEVLGVDERGSYVLPIHLVSLLRGVVRLLDAAPAAAYAADPWKDGGLLGEKDPTVLGIVALMRTRKGER